MPKVIKWGILGTGKIAGKFASDLRYVKDCELLAVGSRSIDTAEAFAKQFSIGRSYGSYEELVRDSDIEVIYISTPHNLHRENTLLCLKNNKSVLCEKPIGVNKQELDEMISVASQRRLFLMEALWTYFLPTILKAQDWIANGEIGEITHIKADFGFKAPYVREKRLFNPNLAGGALLDVGIYPLAFSLLFAQSSVIEINAFSTKSSTNVDFTNVYALKFENNILADLSCSLAHQFRNDGVIFGTKGYIRLPMFWQSRSALLHYYDKEEPVAFDDNRVTNGYNFEAEEVNKLLLAGETESQVMPLSKSIELLSLMDKIREKIGMRYPFE